MTVKVRVALSAGAPSSVTRSVMVFVLGAFVASWRPEEQTIRADEAGRGRRAGIE